MKKRKAKEIIKAFTLGSAVKLFDECCKRDYGLYKEIILEILGDMEAVYSKEYEDYQLRTKKRKAFKEFDNQTIDIAFNSIKTPYDKDLKTLDSIRDVVVNVNAFYQYSDLEVQLKGCIDEQASKLRNLRGAAIRQLKDSILDPESKEMEGGLALTYRDGIFRKRKHN